MRDNNQTQAEAALALGMQPGKVFRLIVLPPALRAIYPLLACQFIMLTLTTSICTSICTSIAAYELTSVAQRIESDTLRSFEVYFTITAMYFAISWLTLRGRSVEKRMAKSTR